MTGFTGGVGSGAAAGGLGAGMGGFDPSAFDPAKFGASGAGAEGWQVSSSPSLFGGFLLPLPLRVYPKVAQCMIL